MFLCLSPFADTQGPEIRTGDINENFYMNVGDIYEITVSGSEQIEQSSTITVNYQDMIKDVKRVTESPWITA